MAILVNIGQRGFVLKEGMIAPGQQITVDQETAEKLSRTYPKELKLIMPDPIKRVTPVAEVKEKEAEVVEEKVEEVKVEPKKRGRKKAK